MPEIYFHLALAQSNLGQYEEALISYGNANKNDQQTLYGERLSFANLGRLEEAARAITKALEINSLDREAWGLKGQILTDLGRHQEAHACFRKSKHP